MRRYLSQRGFTLIELMVVIVIVGILALIVVPKIMSRPEQARRVRAKQDVLAIHNAMDLYHLDNGFYPSEEQGIQTLVIRPETDPQPTQWPEGGYLTRLPKDPWGHSYQYKNPGEHGAIDLFTYGESGTEKTLIGDWQS